MNWPLSIGNTVPVVVLALLAMATAVALQAHAAGAGMVTVGYSIKGVGIAGTGAHEVRRCVESTVSDMGTHYLDTTCGL